MERSEDPRAIVRCNGCDSRVRAYATHLEPTGEHGDLERWCKACLGDIDEYSASLVPNNSEALEALSNVLLDEGEHLDATDPD